MIRRARPRWMAGAVAGYRWGVLGAVGIGLLSTLAAAMRTDSSVLEPVAQAVMQLTPVSIANVLIQRLGIAARPLALMGALAVCMAVGGMLGAAVGIALNMVRRPVRRAVSESVEAPVHRSRRSAMGDTALVLSGAAGIAGVSVVDAMRRDRLAEASGGALFAFEPPSARVTGFPIEGQLPEVTPVPAFYVVSKNAQDPYVDSSLWRLRVDGLVQRPFSVSLDELLSMPRIDQFVTFQCVSNPVGGSLMSNALWSGAALAPLLERAGVLPAAGRVVFSAPDGHEESVPLEVALKTHNLIAYAMNGERLTRLHGHPARALLPGLYGFKQVKWLTHIRVAEETHRGYWPRRGWTDEAVIRTTTRIDVARREAGGIRAAGMALAGARSVGRVDVRTLGAGRSSGEWVRAELHVPPLSGMTWVQWRALLPIPVDGGDVTIEARAVDGTGREQEPGESGPFPNGSSGYHRAQLRA